MSSITHHVLAVTTYKEQQALECKKKADQMFISVTDVIISKVNGYYTVFIGSSGSKAGWTDDEMHEEAIDGFKAWVEKQAYEDGSNSIECGEWHY